MKRKDMNPLERSIHSRERGIARMKLNIKRIRTETDEDIAGIERRINEKQILLDALRRGRIRK